MAKLFIPSIIVCAIAILIALMWRETVSISSGKSYDITPENYQIPVYPKATHIDRYSRMERQAKGVDFKVKQNFPANDITEYYESEMKRLGWSQYRHRHNKKFDRTWQGYVARAYDPPRYVAEYVADWIHYERLEQARLILRYNYANYENPSAIQYSANSNLSGTIQVTPYVKRHLIH